MAVTSGFFNSVNHDRLYNAEQLSSIFDDIIEDGVFQNVGDAFMVNAVGDYNDRVSVGTGRAWFDHTWTLNDTPLTISVDPPNIMLDRIDAIVIDVDRNPDVRKNSIVYVKGIEDTYPEPPELIKTDLRNQYPLAYIARSAGESAPVKQSDITYKVGSDECPSVTGILKTQNFENLWAQLDSEFREWWEGVSSTLEDSDILELLYQIQELQNSLEEINTRLPTSKPNLSFSQLTMYNNTTYLPDGKYCYYNYSERKIHLYNETGVEISNLALSTADWSGTGMADSDISNTDFHPTYIDSYPCTFMLLSSWTNVNNVSYSITAGGMRNTVTISEDGVISQSPVNVSLANNAKINSSDYGGGDSAASRGITLSNKHTYMAVGYGGNAKYGTSGSNAGYHITRLYILHFDNNGVLIENTAPIGSQRFDSSSGVYGLYMGEIASRMIASRREDYIYITGFAVNRNTIGSNLYATYLPLRVSNFTINKNMTTDTIPKSINDLRVTQASSSGVTWKDLETYVKDGTEKKLILKQYDAAVKANVPYGYTDILPFTEDIAICKAGVSGVIPVIYKGHRYYFSGNESNITISNSDVSDDRVNVQGDTTIISLYDNSSYTINNSDWWLSGTSCQIPFSYPTHRDHYNDNNTGSVIRLREV